MAKKKKDNNLDYLSMPKLNLDEKAKHSLGIVAVFAFGLISLLGLVNLSGVVGVFLSKWLTLIFGFGKWLVPLVFLFWGMLLVRNKKYEIKTSDYIGLVILFISYQTLFHFFISESEWQSTVATGIGGGYLGLWFSQFFNYLFGFWGGVIILLCLFLVSLVIVFNTSLSKIVGQESFLAIIFRPIGKLFSIAFSPAEEGEEKPNRRRAKEFIDEAREDILGSWTKKKITAEVEEDESEEDEEEEEIEEPTAAVLKKDTPKVQEKIDWPKKKFKIDIPVDLLNHKVGQAVGGDTNANGLRIKKTLENFGIPVEMGETKVGPTVTQYTFKPAEGVKLSKITTLSNDLSLALAAHPIRIEAPIPGQSLVGIEVPNKTKAIVGLREILEDNVFKNRKHNLMIALGKDVSGTAWIYDITKMPHLLVAGATNSGKSVCLNTIIISLLYQNNPEDLRFIMVDPKRVELPAYNGIPHLLVPVITDVSKTINALKWCLNEMNSRYDTLNKSGKKNIQSYNADGKEKMPYIIFVIDELADFMMTAGKEMEAAIIRLAQMSRAVGIHLILATQRPSVDVITGLIKANIPARIAFSVTSIVDSKTILDMSGAEKLLGQGDMLLSTSELSKPKRIQGAYVTDDEINDVINYIKEKSGEPEYLDGVTDRQKVGGVAGVGMDGNYGDEDELMEQAKEVIIAAGRASTSLLQRRLSIGYGRAAKILDMLEEHGFIGPSNGSKPREVLVSKEQYENSGAISGMPVHSRTESHAPASYLDEDVSDELHFADSKEEEVEPEEEEIVVEEETPDFLLDENGPEDEVETEEEILEEIKEDVKEIKKVEEKKPRPLDDDDDFFAR